LLRVVDHPKVDRDYPGSYGDVLAWFPDDAACLDYLDWLRWPDGFCCPHCESTLGWRLADARWSCGGCSRRVSATAGTIFHGTRTPLTVWFAAAWHMTSQKQGISALGLKRVLGVGSEQTAWAMLHRYRTAMIRPGRDRLAGVVEVDEMYVGGPEPGRSGRGALGKTLVAIAVEKTHDVLGRCRMQVIPDASAASLREFLDHHVEPGALVVTDGWPSYPPAIAGKYRHERIPVSTLDGQAHVLLPAVHRVAGLVKRWLLGTHQGGVKPEHLQAYLDEFAFRFNRRRARTRGMLFYRLLQQAVEAPPRTYRSLVAVPRRGYSQRRHPPPLPKRVHADSLARDPAQRPWRVNPLPTTVTSGSLGLLH
jgi:transposase-like protein